jgi:hypothetical protein
MMHSLPTFGQGLDGRRVHRVKCRYYIEGRIDRQLLLSESVLHRSMPVLEY